MSVLKTLWGTNLSSEIQINFLFSPANSALNHLKIELFFSAFFSCNIVSSSFSYLGGHIFRKTILHSQKRGIFVYTEIEYVTFFKKILSAMRMIIHVLVFSLYLFYFTNFARACAYIFLAVSHIGLTAHPFLKESLCVPMEDLDIIVRAAL